MKKLFILLFYFISFKVFGQYPVSNSLGSDSTLVTSKGATKSRFVNIPFTDTAQANNQRIKFYNGAQIFTYTGGAKFWIRDYTLNKWVQIGAGGGGGFATADNGLTANTSTNVQLGGRLNQSTTIYTGVGNQYSFELRDSSSSDSYLTFEKSLLRGRIYNNYGGGDGHLSEFSIDKDDIAFGAWNAFIAGGGTYSQIYSSASGGNSLFVRGDSSSLQKRISYTSNINGSLTANSLITKRYADSLAALSSSLTQGAGTAFFGTAVTTIPFYKDTLYVLGSGQSNMGFNSQQVGTDTSFDYRVQVWDWFSGSWKPFIVGQSPTTESAFTNSANMLFYFARKFVRETGKYVKVVLHDKGSQPISSWFNGTTRGPQLDSTLNKLIASGMPRVDIVVWCQGESDQQTIARTYMTAYDSIKATIRRNAAVYDSTKFIVVGLPNPKWNAPPLYNNAEHILKYVEINNDIWDGFADTDSATTNSVGNNVHYNNTGLKVIGEKSIWNTYMRLPYTNAGPVYGTFSNLLISHKDSIGGVGSLVKEQLIIRNETQNGFVGWKLQDSANADVFRFSAPNKSGLSYSPFANDETILSAEGAANPAIGLYTAFSRRLRIDASFINAYKPVQINNSANNGLSYVSFNGDVGASQWLVGVTGSAYSGAAQSSLIFFNNASFVYTNSISSLGRMRFGDGTLGTAFVHVKAGTAGASGAQIKLDNGVALSTAEAGTLNRVDDELQYTNGSLIPQGITLSQQKRVSTQFDATSSTTLANVTGLSVSVAAGKIYRFEAKLYTTSNVAGGVKAAIAGTATATNIIYEGLSTDAGLSTQGRGTALATAVGGVTAVTAAYITITGTITVNAAGTLTVQFAQNASNGTASSVLVGSTFVVIEIS